MKEIFAAISGIFMAIVSLVYHPPIAGTTSRLPSLPTPEPVVAQMRINMPGGILEEGKTYQAQVLVNTKGTPIKAVAFEIKYLYTDTPMVKLMKVMPSATLNALSDTGLSYPIRKVFDGKANHFQSAQGVAVFTTAEGFKSESEFELATIEFQVVGNNQKIVNLDFDSGNTRIPDLKTKAITLNLVGGSAQIK